MLLNRGYGMEGDGRLAGRLGAVDLDDPAFGIASDADGDVQGQDAC